MRDPELQATTLVQSSKHNCCNPIKSEGRNWKPPFYYCFQIYIEYLIFGKVRKSAVSSNNLSLQCSVLAIADAGGNAILKAAAAAAQDKRHEHFTLSFLCCACAESCLSPNLKMGMISQRERESLTSA